MFGKKSLIEKDNKRNVQMAVQKIHSNSEEPLISPLKFRKAKAPDAFAASPTKIDKTLIQTMPIVELEKELAPHIANSRPEENPHSFLRHMDSFKDNMRFYDLVESASDQDCTEVAKIIKEHPSYVMYERGDPKLLVNRQNLKGHIPVEVAIRNNNVKMLKLLMENGATLKPPKSKSIIANSSDSLLELACRWGFSDMAYIIRVADWSEEELRHALESTDNKETRRLLKEKIKSIRKGSCELF